MVNWTGGAFLLAVVIVAVQYLDKASEPAPEPVNVVRPAPADDAFAPRAVRLAADGRGHFTARAHINGRRVHLMVDTGASRVVLNDADARHAGFQPSRLDYSVPVATANGTAYAAAVMLDEVELDGIVRRNVPALIAHPDALSHSLLGMSFLGRLRQISIEGNSLVMTE